MAMGRVVSLAALVASLIFAMASREAEATITCGQVTGALSQCIPYLQKGGAVPGPCCSGVKSLNSAAKTTPDRQTACACLKSAYSAISGINPANAASLPGKCGVSIPYKISPTTDCSKVK